MGKALRDGYRERAFVMAKVDGRTAKAAREQLEQSLSRLRVERIDPLSTAERAALLKKTEVAAREGKYEKYKSTQVFDATARHPEWLG